MRWDGMACLSPRGNFLLLISFRFLNASKFLSSAKDSKTFQSLTLVWLREVSWFCILCSTDHFCCGLGLTVLLCPSPCLSA